MIIAYDVGVSGSIGGRANNLAREIGPRRVEGRVSSSFSDSEDALALILDVGVVGVPVGVLLFVDRGRLPREDAGANVGPA